MAQDRDASGHLVIIDGHVVHTDIDEGPREPRAWCSASLHDAVGEPPRAGGRSTWPPRQCRPRKASSPHSTRPSGTDGIFLLRAPGREARRHRCGSPAGSASRVWPTSQPNVLIVAETSESGLLRGRGALRRLRGPDLHVVGGGGHGPGRRPGPVRRGAASRTGRLLPGGAAYSGRPRRHPGHAERGPGRLPPPGSTSTPGCWVPGANSDMLGLYFGDGDTALRLQHQPGSRRAEQCRRATSSTRARWTARAAQCSEASSGCTRAHRSTDAYQTNRNLLLSPDARADSAAEPRDRGRRREVLPWRHRGRAGRRGEVLPHERAASAERAGRAAGGARFPR